jgi:hypothetical protein
MGETMIIPVLGMWQPHASLVALGEKRVETRAFSAGRFHIKPGPLAIHATKKWDAETRGSFDDPAFMEAFRRHGGYRGGNPAGKHTNLPLGAIIAVVDFKGSVPMFQCACVGSLSGADADCQKCKGTGIIFGGSFHTGYQDLVTAKECAFGDWHEGRYGWVFGVVLELFDEPINIAGRQQIGWPWEWKR